MGGIEETLREIRSRFARVFFCPGNHDLWVRRNEGVDSVERMREILKLCGELGIETSPAEVRANSRGVLVVPLLSWHHPQWDTEPELSCWNGVLPAAQVV